MTCLSDLGATTRCLSRCRPYRLSRYWLGLTARRPPTMSPVANRVICRRTATVADAGVVALRPEHRRARRRAVGYEAAAGRAAHRAGWSYDCYEPSPRTAPTWCGAKDIVEALLDAPAGGPERQSLPLVWTDLESRRGRSRSTLTPRRMRASPGEPYRGMRLVRSGDGCREMRLSGDMPIDALHADSGAPSLSAHTIT
jgi:hypothetical protein